MRCRRYLAGSCPGKQVGANLEVGLFNAQGPPVPIPNTEVKLCGAEDTWREAVRENRSRPTPFYIPLQLSWLEHLTVNQGVVSSSLTRGAIKMLQKSNLAKNPCISRVFCYFRSKNDVCKTVQLFWSLYDLNSRQLSRKYGRISVNHTHYTE